MQKLPAKKINHVLPPLRDVPVALAALTPLEQRLVAMAKVDQVLIDKLPSGGRMYIVKCIQGLVVLLHVWKSREAGFGGLKLQHEAYQAS